MIPAQYSKVPQSNNQELQHLTDSGQFFIEFQRLQTVYADVCGAFTENLTIGRDQIINKIVSGSRVSFGIDLLEFVVKVITVLSFLC